MTTITPHPYGVASSLISKIAQASQSVGALKVDKTNHAQNYSYISADKILDKAGAALAAVGVVVIPSVTLEHTERVEAGNKVRFDSLVHFAMTITDGETSLEVPWIGRGSDFLVPDKAMYKAITSGHKYFLVKLLNIGAGNEDGDNDTVEDTAATGSAPTGAAATGSSSGYQNGAPSKKKPNLLSAAQEKRIHELGAQLYGQAKWDQRVASLVLDVTKGAVDAVATLMPSEADVLIADLEKRLKEKSAIEATASKVDPAAKVTAA